MLLTRAAAVSAVANLSITYLNEFFPSVKAPLAKPPDGFLNNG
jgi:hypothetical protein